jgi:hypothetical protein
MKQPVIRIKKGAVVYDDRQAQDDARVWRPRLTPVARSRHRAPRRRSVFFPLLVLAVVLVVVIVYVQQRQTADTAVLDGWKAELHAQIYEGALLAGVTFIRAGDAPIPVPPPVAIVRFKVPGARETTAVTGALERSPFTISARLAGQARASTISAVVILGDQEKTLAARIRRGP